MSEKKTCIDLITSSKSNANFPIAKSKKSLLFLFLFAIYGCGGPDYKVESGRINTSPLEQTNTTLDTIILHDDDKKKILEFQKQLDEFLITEDVKGIDITAGNNSKTMSFKDIYTSFTIDHVQEDEVSDVEKNEHRYTITFVTKNRFDDTQENIITIKIIIKNGDGEEIIELKVYKHDILIINSEALHIAETIIHKISYSVYGEST